MWVGKEDYNDNKRHLSGRCACSSITIMHAIYLEKESWSALRFIRFDPIWAARFMSPESVILSHL
jgi:hypothetical protein